MIYALDVDGVILDSSAQLVIDGFNAYRKFYKNTKLFDNKKLTLKNYKYLFKKHKSTKNKFLKLHVYSKSAGEMVLNYKLIDNKEKINNDKDYRKKIKNTKSLKKWNIELYKQRKKFQKQKGWQKIIKPFKKTIEFIKKNKKDIVILSNKDIFTIKNMLKFYKINISNNKLYTKEITNNKNKKLRMIKDDLKIRYQDITFIDDNFVNLKEANKLKVNCQMATWGFNNKEQQKEAKKLGIKTLEKISLSQSQKN